MQILLKKIDVPKKLENISVYDPNEAAAGEAGMTDHGVEAIWKGVERLYRTGIHPAIHLCLRRKGKMVLNRAIGHASGNGPGDNCGGTNLCPATPETPVCMFSASKAITAMLIHLLDQEGAISLLDPVSYYLPEFASCGKKNTTIHHILCHRGGIPTIEPDTNPEILFDWDAMIKMLCRTRPISPGGRRMAYHAVTGGFILGEIIRVVTGMDIRKFLRQKVQIPLGFKYFNFGLPPENLDQVAVNYYTGRPVIFPLSNISARALGAPWEQVVDISNDPRFMECIIPSGNLIATANEMSQFFQMLLNQGELNGVRIFDPLTVRRAVMYTGHLEIDATLILPLRYSAGMMLGASPIGMYGPFTENAFGHLGFINIFCWADPERDISVSLLTTGKALLGPHLLPLTRLLTKISWYCPRMRLGKH